MPPPKGSDPAARRIGAVVVVACALLAVGAAQTAAAQEGNGAERFREIATVLQSPRCMNCHTGENFPRQGAIAIATAFT